MKRLAFLCLGLCVLVPTRAGAEVEVLDYGAYEIYQDDRPLGTETFAFERHSDSLFIHCASEQQIPWPDRVLELEKSMRLLTSRFDGSLILYESIQTLDGRRLVRAISPADTAMTVYRENERGGEGQTIVKPPGRLFVIDPHVFTLYDVIAREFAGREFEERRINIFVLTQQDTLIEGTVRKLGTETIRWGAKPVQATKLRIGDSTSELFAYVGPQGYMLELRQPATGLRVIRKAQDVKPPGSP